MEQETIQQLVKDFGGIRKTARELQIPPSALCEYLKGTYRGNPQRIIKVFEHFINQVECPVIGMISREKCREYQAKPFKATNGFNAKFKFACRTCLQSICNPVNK